MRYNLLLAVFLSFLANSEGKGSKYAFGVREINLFASDFGMEDVNIGSGWRLTASNPSANNDRTFCDTYFRIKQFSHPQSKVTLVECVTEPSMAATLSVEIGVNGENHCRYEAPPADIAKYLGYFGACDDEEVSKSPGSTTSSSEKSASPSTSDTSNGKEGKITKNIVVTFQETSNVNSVDPIALVTIGALMALVF